MLDKLFHIISAERTDINQKAFLPTFFQHEKVYEFCKEFVKNKNVLEIGCGVGYGANMLSGYSKEYIGCDSDKYSILKNKRLFKQKNLSFIHTDADNFPENEKFDVVISLQVIEHIQNVDLFLEKISLLLKKNGIVIISTPNASTQSYNENPYHFKEYKINELKKLFESRFSKIKLYGLQGDKKVKLYEKNRRQNIKKILRKDKFKLRNMIPRRIKQVLFDLASYANKSLIISKDPHFYHITGKNYYISKNTINAIDLILVAEKL